MLQRLSVTADGPEKQGAMYPSLDRTIGIDWPLGGGVESVYTVTSGKKLVAQALTFDVRPGRVGEAWVPVGAASIQNMGTVRVDIGASQLSEWRYQWFPTPAAPGADEMVVQQHNANQTPGIGEGVICPSGTQLQVRCTPASATPRVWKCTVGGMKSATAYIQSGRRVTGATTADQTILSVTPDADWTINSILIAVELQGQLLGTAAIRVGGQIGWESSYIGLEQTASNMWDDRGYGGYGQGAVTIPLWGITFYEGERIGLVARPFQDDDSVWQLVIAGAETDLAAGGGNTYSRARVVSA